MIVVGYGMVKLPFLTVKISTISVIICTFGIKLDSLIIVIYSTVKVAYITIGFSAVIVYLSLVGIQSDA